jgi:hypothetical protein
MKSIWKTRKINLFSVDECYKKGSVDVQTYFGRIFVTSWFVPRVRARALRPTSHFRIFNSQNGALRAPHPTHRSFADP